MFRNLVATLVTGLKISARNPTNLVAKAAVSALPFVGLAVEIPNLYVKIITGLGLFVASISTVSYITKLNVPEALAVGYFMSFVEPVGRALKTGAGEIEYYDDESRKKARMKLDPEKLDASLKIVLPKDLSLGENASGTGTDEYQVAIKAKALGEIYLPGRARPYTVHFEMRNLKNVKSLMLYDVPTALNPLRQILFDEETKQSSIREKRAKIALKEFSNKLRDEKVRFRSDIGNVGISDGESLETVADFKMPPENAARPKHK